MGRSDWYDTRWGLRFSWGVLGATLVGVGASMGLDELRVPAAVYLFGFLGATVYAFTSFAKRFDDDGRSRLKILSRTVAVIPLAATGEAAVTAAGRLVAGVVFLAGVYVSATLRALGGLADRLLGIDPREDSTADPEADDR